MFILKMRVISQTLFGGLILTTKVANVTRGFKEVKKRQHNLP